MRSYLVALLLLAACAGAFWYQRVHVEQPLAHGTISSDMERYFYPMAVHMHRELRGDRIPLWNPYQMAGAPFLATQQPGVLYPSRVVLLRWLRPARALELDTVLHLVLAGFFTWLLAARLGLGAIACLTASLAFMLSSELQLRVYNLAVLSSIAWLPGLLWAVHGVVSEPGVRRALTLGVFLAFAFLAGLAPVFLFEIQLAAAYGLVGLFFVVPRGQRTRAVGFALAGGALALGLGAVQLLPTLELAAQASRGLEPLTLREASLLALTPAELVRGLFGSLPELAGAETESVNWGRVSALCLPLALCGFADRSRRVHWAFFAVAALFAGLFMLGQATPVFRVYHALPIGGLFRFPFRISFVYVFCLCVLQGIGVQGISNLLRRRRRAAHAAMLGVASLVAVETCAHNEIRFALPILWGEQRFAPGALIDYLTARRRDGRVFVQASGAPSPVLQPALGMVNQLFAVPTYGSLLPGDYAAYFRGGRFWKGRLLLDRGVGGRLGPELARLLDLMSVRYYATSGDPTGVKSFAGGDAVILGPVTLAERTQALPRAYLVHAVVVEPDRKRALAQLQAASFDPREQAIVDRPVPDLGSPGEEEERARIRDLSSERVSVDARCSADCLLVLTDLDYPGWEARVDGERAEIVRVNTLFRGVRLPPGEHRIVYSYRPASFRYGAAVSSAAAGLVVCGVLFAGLRRSAGPGL
jgi:hypothetical protein